MVPNIDGTMRHKIKTRKYPRHGKQCVIQYLDTWSGFEAAKTAPWPSRGLHNFVKFLEPSYEWAGRGCYCFLMRWHSWAFLAHQEWATENCRAQIWIFQIPSTIPSRKCNNCIWTLVVQLVAKISERHRKVLKLKNSNLSPTNFWSLFLMSQKWRTMSPHQESTASSTSSLIWGLKEFTEVGSPWLGHGAVLAASKPLHVSKYLV